MRVALTHRRAPLLAAAIAILAGAAHLLWANRGTYLYLDDWDFTLSRADLNDVSLFGPQNQNWHTTNVLVFRVLAELFGLGTYVPARLLAVAVLVAIAVLVAFYAWTRLSPWAAAPAVLPLFFTAGWESVLWPFQMSQLISIAAGLGALLLLQRDAAGRRAVGGAAALLVLAVASSSAGVPMLGVVLIDRLLRPGERRGALAVGPAVLAYLWWTERYGHLSPNPNPSDANQVLVGLRQSVDTGSAAIQSFLGFGGVWGSIAGFLLLVGLFVVLCWRIFAGHPADRARIAALLAGLVGYWVLLSYGRSNVTGYYFSPRYLFISMVLLTLLLVELARSGTLQLRAMDPAASPSVPRWVWTRALPGLAVLLLLNASWQNGQTLRQGGFVLRSSAEAMRGQIAALSLLPPEKRDGAPFFLDPVARGIVRPANLYFGGQRQFGGPMPDDAEIRRTSEAVRVQTDRALLALAGGEVPVGEEPPPPAGPPPVVPGARPVGRSCVAVTAATDLDETPLPIGPRLSVTNTGDGPLTLFASRYGPVTQGSGLGVPPGGSRVVQIAPDLGQAPWQLGVRGRAALVCSVPG